MVVTRHFVLQMTLLAVSVIGWPLPPFARAHTHTGESYRAITRASQNGTSLSSETLMAETLSLAKCTKWLQVSPKISHRLCREAWRCVCTGVWQCVCASRGVRTYAYVRTYMLWIVYYFMYTTDCGVRLPIERLDCVGYRHCPSLSVSYIASFPGHTQFCLGNEYVFCKL